MTEPNKIDPKLQEATRQAGKRLHHLSLRYVGALAEVARGRPLGLLAQGEPGLSEMRDLIDLILLTRAEINGLTKILIEAGIVDGNRLNAVFAEEYEWLTKVKAEQLGVEVFDGGITIKAPPAK